MAPHPGGGSAKERFRRYFFFDFPSAREIFEWHVCGCERERDAQPADTLPTMAENSDATTTSTAEAVEEVQTPTPEQEKANEGEPTAEEEGKDPVSNEGAPAEGAADAAATSAKRKSHRPSLEVVEVTVDSFYDKGTFKQELQVCTAAVCTAEAAAKNLFSSR